MATDTKKTILDWKSLIELDMHFSPTTAEADAAHISAVLDAVNAAPLGQVWLQKLKAEQSEKKLLITNSRDKEFAVNIDTRVVNINPEQLAVQQYCGLDGEYHRGSFEQALLHEIFGHVASGNMDIFKEQQANTATNAIQRDIGSHVPLRGDYYDCCIDRDQLRLAMCGDDLKKFKPAELAKHITFCDAPPVEERAPLNTPTIPPRGKGPQL